MKTRFLIKDIYVAIKILSKGEVLSYPTESVFAIGCDPDSHSAILNLLSLKKRSMKKGLILIADNYSKLQPYIDDTNLSLVQKKSLVLQWPKNTTFVFPKNSTTPVWLSGNFNSLAIRVTNHPIVIQLCKIYGKPLVSTSANLSGLMPCRTSREVHDQFGYTFPVIQGNTQGEKNPSRVRDILTGKIFR